MFEILKVPGAGFGPTRAAVKNRRCPHSAEQGRGLNGLRRRRNLRAYAMYVVSAPGVAVVAAPLGSSIRTGCSGNRQPAMAGQWISAISEE